MNIVPINQNYNSILLRQNITELNSKFPFLNIQTIGNSVLETPLYVIKLGKGTKKVFYSSSIHANEWITSVILMKFIEDYCNSYISNSNLFGYSVRDIFNSTSIYLMPMINPDGVDLVTGLFSPTHPAYGVAKRISDNFPDIPFPNRLESQY